MGTPDADAGARTHWPRELDAEYELIGELGKGGMAVVFRARDRVLGREVAIKVVRPRISDDEGVSRLAREARTVAQLQHPNIVGVHSIRHLTDRSVALVMQLVPGRTLKSALQQDGAFDAKRTEHVLRDVARALAFANAAGVVHRDVKPENIFLDEVSGRAMLSDFGVARVMDAPSELTATGTTIGTPTYMAPEQIDGVHVDGRSDLYSLGMVAWEMLAGERPWSGESLYQVIYRQKHDLLPSIDQIRSDVPPRLQFLIEGMVQKNPDRRWSGAARFLSLLASEQQLPGFREWQSLQKRRRRSSVYQQARKRGGSVLDAAFETVKFVRGEPATPASSPAVAVEPPPPPTLPDSPAALIERAMVEPALPEFAVGERSRLRWALPAAGALVVVIAAVWLLKGRNAVPPPRETTSLLRDRPGVEVPVVKAAPPPPIDSQVAARPDSASKAAATPNDADTKLAAASPALKKAAPSRTKAGPVPKASERAARTTRADSLAALAAAKKAADSTRSVASARGRGTPPASVSTVQPPPRPVATAPIPPPEPPPAAASLSFPVERVTVSAGGRHSCLLGEGGRAWCWGNNEGGQLGDGTFEGHATPARVAGEFAFTQIAAGAWHTCGLTGGGELYCWGKNDAGQLGDGTTTERTAPVRVNSSVPFKAVRTGNAHTCALSRAGTVFCWGTNAYGQVGDGSHASRTSPAAVPLPAGVAALTVGYNHSCALTLDGTAYCWGRNNGGQLGDGTTSDHASPTAVDTDLRFLSIAAGFAHSCGVSTAGLAACWGQNTYGQLGSGGASSPTPRVVESVAPFLTIVAGNQHTCARARDARAWCWGRNAYGQLGDGSTSDRSRPIAVSGLSGLSSLHASGAHTCAMTLAGDAYCWGYNIDGQVGSGDRENGLLPSRILLSR